MTRARSRSERAWLIATLIMAIAYWALDLLYFRHGVPALLDDTWEYAVAARHLLAGDGFVTSVIHPPFWTLRDEALRVPILIHGPLVPVLFAPILLVMGPGIVIRMAGLAAGFALVAAWLTFRIGTKLAGRRVGAAAALLFTVAPLTLQAVHHDVALLAGACFLLLAIDALIPGGEMDARDASGAMAPIPARRAFAAGLALGLGYLARPEFLLAAPVLAIAAGRGAAALGLGLVIAAGPWWFHQWQASGLPLFNLSSYLAIGYWGRHPDLTVLRDFHLPPAAWPDALRAALPDLPEKWAHFFPRAVKRLLSAPTVGTSGFAILGLAAAIAGARVRAGDTAEAARAVRRFGLVAAGLALIPLAVMTITVYDERYITPFLPLWALGAAFGAAWLAHRLPGFARRGRVWMTLLAIVALPSAIGAWREAADRRPVLVRELADTRAWLRAVRVADLPADRVLFSATPDFAAWYLNRPVVWLTRDEYALLPACDAIPEAPAANGAAGRDAAGARSLAPCRDRLLGLYPPAR